MTMASSAQPVLPTVVLRPVVRFREFPFGTADDPSMRDSISDSPWPLQQELLQYPRSGQTLGVTMGADLSDWLDRSRKANPIIEGRVEGGTTEMTDGTWFWYAGLIWFVEHYNLHVSDEFIRHAARNHWRVDRDRIPAAVYDCSYFQEPSSA
jgi:hypothetical protein